MDRAQLSKYVLLVDKKIVNEGEILCLFIGHFNTRNSTVCVFPYLLYPKAKRKQTKRVLTKIYYSPQSKISISLEVVGVETKLLSWKLSM